MGDEEQPLENPFDQSDREFGLSEQELLQLDYESQQTVNECAQVLAEIEDKIAKDVDDCVNSCNGDVQLCRACVLGDIADYVNRAGMASNSCGDKIINQVNNAVGMAWAASFELGIQPPTQLQLQQALAGQSIDFFDGSGGTTVSDSDSVTLPPSGGGETGGGQLQPPPIPVNCPQGINPAALSYLTVLPGGGYCIPYAWDVSAVNNWAVIAFGAGPDAHIALLPTSSSPGIWVSNGCDYAIPPVCPQDIPVQPTPPPPGDGSGTLPPGNGGNGNSLPPTPGNGSPSLPGGGGGDTLPGGNGSGGGTVPPVILPPDGTLPCLTQEQAVAIQLARQPQLPLETDFDTDADGNPLCYWALRDIYNVTSSGDYPVIRIGQNCDPACGGIPDPNGNGTTPQPTPTQPPLTPAPRIPSYCDPDNASGILNHVGELNDWFGPKIPDLIKQIKDAAPDSSFSITDIGGIISGLASAIVPSLLSTVTGMVRAVVSVGDAASLFGSTCDSSLFTTMSVQSGLLNIFGGWFGMIPPNLLVPNQYTINLECQYLLPSATEANSYFTRGYIDPIQWEFLVKANGFCPDWQKMDIESRKTRIGIQDAFRLFMLGQLTREQFQESWKRQGIDVDNEEKRWVDAVKQYPGMADLIRMMVRDVGDQSVVDFLKLDGEGSEHFTNKWTGTLRTWGIAQGITDEVAQLFYRAHWQSPSPSQIFEWLHRLREDDRDPNDQFAKLVFTPEDAKRSLAIADYVPGLLDNYIATSYRPLTRVDVRRMWEVGVFTSIDQVRRAYRDLGYDANNAESLARFTIVNSSRSRAKLLGELSVAEIQTAYRNDLVTLSEARDYLARAGLTADQIPVTLDSIENRKTFDSRKIAIASLQKRYFRGEFTDGQARQALIDAFMDPVDAGRAVTNWSFQRNAREKAPTIAMLCRWYGKGMITLDQMLIRVRNLNYNEADALRIVESCNTDVQVRRQKEIEAALAKLQKAQQAAAREQARQVRESKQALRELKLTHVHIHTDKRVRKNGQLTTTVTDKDIQKPDVNISDITEITDINTPPEP